MKTSSKNMAYASVGTGLTVILLYLASIVPSGRLAVVCASSVGVVFLRMRCGKKWAVLCCCASAMLSLLLLPEKGVAILYSVILGYYPLVKLDTERMSSRLLRWCIRLAVFNAAFFLLYFFAQWLFIGWLDGLAGSILLLTLAANAAFVLYDYALTQIILLYLRRIDGRL